MSKNKFSNFSIGDISAKVIIKNLPFVIFLGFLMVIFIANVHHAEKKMREIDMLQKENKKLFWKYMSIKSDLNYRSIQTEVARMVEPHGLKEIKHQPYKITIPENGY